MNAIFNNLRNTTYLINNIFKNSSIYTIRGLKSDLKIKWIRPPVAPAISPQKSGDGGINYEIKSEDFLPGYEKCQELLDADELVKKVFSLEFNSIKNTSLKKRQLTQDMVKRHNYDTGSMEVSLARMTSQILVFQEYMTNHPQNKRIKRILKELIDKRNKCLRKLRKWDYKRFEWILEKLNLTFKPMPQGHVRVERKRSLRLLTADYCEKVRQEKLNAYRAELEKEKRIFFKEKVEQLEFIRAEEIDCGITPSITEEEIAAAREKAAQYE